MLISALLYSQVLWSRQGSDTVRLTTGEPVNSRRRGRMSDYAFGSHL
jgi:hypothetical protein